MVRRGRRQVGKAAVNGKSRHQSAAEQAAIVCAGCGDGDGGIVGQSETISAQVMTVAEVRIRAVRPAEGTGDRLIENGDRAGTRRENAEVTAIITDVCPGGSG